MARKKKKGASWSGGRSSGPSNLQRYKPPKVSGPQNSGTLAPSVQRAPAPNFSASPTPQAMPFDATYNDEIGLNQADLDTSLAEIQYGKGQVAQEYGFDSQGQLDVSNPYNRASLLERHYKQGQRGTLNSGAAGGQLYSGALQRGLDEGTFGYQRDFDTLRRGASDAYHGLSSQEQTARSTYSRNNINASRDRVERAAENRPEDPGYDTAALNRLVASQKWTPEKVAKTTSRSWSQAARRRRKSMGR